jgi:hypothetical protein
MLSDNERRRLEELEASLQQDDPDLARTFAGREPLGSRRRRTVAISMAIVALLAAVAGLIAGNVPVVVMAICAFGLAAGLWLAKSRA